MSTLNKIGSITARLDIIRVIENYIDIAVRKQAKYRGAGPDGSYYLGRIDALKVVKGLMEGTNNETNKNNAA